MAQQVTSTSDVVALAARIMQPRERPLVVSTHPTTGDFVLDVDELRGEIDGLAEKTPAARRIHYWVVPGGGVELSRIVSHDDVRP